MPNLYTFFAIAPIAPSRFFGNPITNPDGLYSFIILSIFVNNSLSLLSTTSDEAISCPTSDMAIPIRFSPKSNPKSLPFNSLKFFISYALNFKVSSMKNITLQNVPSCASEYVLSQYIRKLDKNIFLFLTDESNITDAYELIKFFTSNCEVHKFPDTLQYDSATQDRAATINALINNNTKSKKVIISSVKTISEKIENTKFILDNKIELTINSTINLEHFIKQLQFIGYERVTFVIESGQFASRGDIIDVFTNKPYRIEFFDDTIENIREFNISSQKSIKKVQTIEIYPINCPDDKTETIISLLNIDNSIIIYNHVKIIPENDASQNLLEQISKFNYINFSNFSDHSSEEFKFECNDNLGINYSIQKAIDLIERSNKNILIAAYSDSAVQNLKKILIENTNRKNNNISIAKLPIEKSFETKNNLFISEKDIFKSQLSNKKYNTKNFLTDLNALTEGDYVVHINHGIGEFKRLETIEINKLKHEFMLIVYADGDKLYLPVENINLISRYGSFDANVKLDSLGSNSWKNRRDKISKKISDISKKLIETAALRELSSPFQVELTDEYLKFCNQFPFVETDDQNAAIKDIEKDLTSSKIMDRLICGDVGFGKTEVAIRAAFLTAQAKKQVVILAPTTILAKQHYESFIKRFNGTGIKICQLSRFSKSSQLKKDIEFGNFDIIIGTKCILYQEFKNLGMLIVDEEQHFGVKDKEHIKNLKKSIHVLTLSATPIPRTLQLSLTGIRDLSIISTPPFGKIPTKTLLTDDRNNIIIDAINTELSRNGQVFAVCPHITDLNEVANFIAEKVPDAKIIIAHSKLSTKDLENAIDSFINKSYNVLIATNIIESGLDISSANTLIVFNAHMFGLANLYQLRGRVGRSNIQSYAYFAVPKNKQLTRQAEKRLNILKNMDKLGSGFTIATYDMDIRGAGNLLGEEQSGDLKEIGAELYQKMLKEAINQIKNDSKVLEQTEEIKVNLNRNVLIPASYIEDNDTRIAMYRRISEASKEEEFASIYQEMKDRFGKIPEEVKNLFLSIRIHILARGLGINKISETQKGFIIEFTKFTQITELLTLIQKHSYAEFIPSNKIKISGNINNLEEFLKKLHNIT